MSKFLINLKHDFVFLKSLLKPHSSEVFPRDMGTALYGGYIMRPDRREHTHTHKPPERRTPRAKEKNGGGGGGGGGRRCLVGGRRRTSLCVLDFLARGSVGRTPFLLLPFLFPFSSLSLFLFLCVLLLARMPPPPPFFDGGGGGWKGSGDSSVRSRPPSTSRQISERQRREGP